jgi:hypothetical protein
VIEDIPAVMGNNTWERGDYEWDVQSNQLYLKL